MDENSKLMSSQGEQLSDLSRYKRLVGRLNYLIVTQPDIAFATSIVSQFMATPHTAYWDALMRIMRYVKGAPGQGLIDENIRQPFTKFKTRAS